ncbi:MAG: monosaccharide transporter substrate-binding protein [Frankiales bacterium]|nr:monosaccharide transporter substrate-binding protein [Frankiales bacterium]
MIAKGRLRVVVPLGLAGVVALTSCGTSSSGGGSSSGGSSSSGGTIGVSVPTVEGPFFTAMLYGIEDQAKKAGYKVTILSAGSYSNVDQQVNQIQTLTAKKVDILLVDPADPTATQGPIQQAVSQGLVTLGAGDPAPGAQGSVSAPHCTVGKDLATGAKKLLPQGGNIGVLAGPAGAFWSTERLKCFKQEIAGSGINVVAEKTSDPAISAGLSIASDFLQRYPDLNLLYGADDTVGDGAGKAVQAANRCSKTMVLTAVFGEQAEQLMKDGCVNYDVALQPVLIGREAVKLGIAVKTGKKPDKTEVEIPNVAITPDTMSSVDLSAIRAPQGWKPPV